MGIIDTLVASFAPYECLQCNEEGRLLCDNCFSDLRTVPERCYRCRRISAGWQTCKSCRQVSKLHSVQIRTVYEGVAKDLVWQLKFQGAQQVAKDIARFMAPLIKNKEALIVPVPTTTQRVRQRGYDQACLLARVLASQLKQIYCPALARLGQHHQVGASRRERLSQLNDSFLVTKPWLVKESHILLIDDVLTTGATLEAAAKTLKMAGAEWVDAVVFAQA